MDDVLDDLVRAARSCERAAEEFEAEPIRDIRARLVSAIEEIGRAWSGSWIGYQASVYVTNLRARRPGESFDSEWGAQERFSTTTSGDWSEYNPNTVVNAVSERAGVTEADWERLKALASQTEKTFSAVHIEVVASLDAAIHVSKDASLQSTREKVEALKPRMRASDFAQAIAPKQIMSRDMRAMQGGVVVPPHIQVQARLAEYLSCGGQAEKLATLATQAATYLQKVHKMRGKTIAKTDGRIFIGHGASPAWRDLKDFVHERLKLPWDEFNREPAAGMSTKERLEQMLDSASFAFLVMTAEDEKADGTKHARANVIHEVGLFQGRLGFDRAIVLLENGCAEFSNIVGVTQIRFASGNLDAKFEEIRRVLERAGILRS